MYIYLIEREGEKKRGAAAVSLPAVARATAGFSGADLRYISICIYT